MNTIILRKLNSLISLDIQDKLSHFEEKIIIKLLKLLNEKKKYYPLFILRTIFK
jgi:hypothetical protein